MMPFEEAVAPAVLLAVDDHGVALVTLNRPDRGNGWTAEVSRAYFPLIRDLAADPQVRAIVITGGGHAFCVGADGEKLSGVAGADQAAVIAPDDYLAPARVGKPVIAAINGACFGIGLQQALCCDVRIASENAKFSTAYARRGLVAEYGVSWLLPRIVGIGHAMDLLLSARLLRAQEAAQMGLVNRVVPAAELMDTVVGYARDLAERCSPAAMRAIKQQLHADLNRDMTRAYEQSRTGLAEAMRSDDFREGVRSWQERRPPNFPTLTQNLSWIDLGDPEPEG